MKKCPFHESPHPETREHISQEDFVCDFSKQLKPEQIITSTLPPELYTTGTEPNLPLFYWVHEMLDEFYKSDKKASIIHYDADTTDEFSLLSSRLFVEMVTSSRAKDSEPNPRKDITEDLAADLASSFERTIRATFATAQWEFKDALINPRYTIKDAASINFGPRKDRNSVFAATLGPHYPTWHRRYATQGSMFLTKKSDLDYVFEKINQFDEAFMAIKSRVSKDISRIIFGAEEDNLLKVEKDPLNKRHIIKPQQPSSIFNLGIKGFSRETIREYIQSLNNDALFIGPNTIGAVTLTSKGLETRNFNHKELLPNMKG